MVEPPRKKRCGNIVPEQKELLCAFIGRNEDLKNNKFTATFTFKDAQNKWLEISAELNAVPGGAVKDWKSWRKTWHDWKSATKTKAAKERRCARDTGGGEPVKLLKDSDSAMLDLISKVSLEGDAEILESAVDFNFDYQDGDDENKYFNPNIESETMKEKVILSANKQQIISSSTKSDTVPPGSTATPTTSKEASAKTIPKTRMLRKKIRFEETTKFTQKIADSTEHDVQVRREYYTAKLHLMERDVEAKERIAAACEVISTKVLSSIGNATTDADEDEDLLYEDVRRAL